MTKAKKPDAIEVAVEPVVEHVPIIPESELPVRQLTALDAALRDGEYTDSDGRRARRVEPPSEAALVHLAKSDLLYAGNGVPPQGLRNVPSERWLPVAMLTPGQLNGWVYKSAKRLFDVPTTPIFMELERLFGRGHGWDSGNATSAEGDLRKISSFERVTLDGMVELNNEAPGQPSASRTEFVKFRGCWLGFRHISKLAARRAAAGLDINYNPLIKPT